MTHRLRSIFLGSLFLVPAWAMPCAPAGSAAHGDRSARRVLAVDRIGLTVSDMDRSVAFFRDVLTFEPESDVELAGEEYERLMGVFGLRLRVVAMRLGDERIELMQYVAPRGRPMPAESRANDRWFQHIAIIVSDMDKAFERLRKHNVEFASTGPQTIPAWNAAAAGIRAFYFRDPDGHFLEILWFPPGKGDPKWHHPTDRLFLGIDHTAIVVQDTNASLSHYRDELGLKVVGESENYGIEQERLNNVFGARLRITTLRAEHGPAIEFLEYVTPRDGRPAPADTRANDIWNWHVRLQVASLETEWRGGSSEGSRWISPGAQTIPDSPLGMSMGLLTRDRDGHALLLVQP